MLNKKFFVFFISASESILQGLPRRLREDVGNGGEEAIGNSRRHVFLQLKKSERVFPFNCRDESATYRVFQRFGHELVFSLCVASNFLPLVLLKANFKLKP